MYFPAIHEGIIQQINPWLCRETVCSPGECESKMFSDIAQLGNRAKLGPKTANSVTMSAIIPENQVVKSKKGKMALRTEILQTHREALSFRDAKFVATIWPKPSKVQFFHLFPINIRVFTLYSQQNGHTGINECLWPSSPIFIIDK